MISPASAAELAFYSARVALARESLTPTLEVAWAEGPPVTEAEVVLGIQEAAKPVRITGSLSDSMLRLRVSEVSSDPDAAHRFQILRRNSGDNDHFLERNSPRDALILVIAFDQLLKVSPQTWQEFRRDCWVDATLGWAGGETSSGWAQNFGVPAPLLQDVGLVVHAGYGTGTSLRHPYVASAWGRGPSRP